MSVCYAKNFQISSIKFNDNAKRQIQQIDGKEITVHSIDMYANNAPVYIQLDKAIVKDIDGNNCVHLEVSKQTADFIKGIEECIVEKVYENSERWFNGKRFTWNKIKGGLVSCIKENRVVVTCNKDTVFFNQFKKRMSLSDVASGLECVCIVRFCCLQFIGNKFSYKINVEQCKVNVEHKLEEYSILEDSENEEVTPITESDSEQSYREYPEYYKSEVDSDGANFF